MPSLLHRMDFIAMAQLPVSGTCFGVYQIPPPHLVIQQFDEGGVQPEVHSTLIDFHQHLITQVLHRSSPPTFGRVIVACPFPANNRSVIHTDCGYHVGMVWVGCEQAVQKLSNPNDINVDVLTRVCPQELEICRTILAHFRNIYQYE